MAGDVSKHLERAKRFLEKNRVEDAIEAYLAVLGEAPQHQEATQALGDLYARMDQPERAAVYYGMLFDLLVDPKDETKALAIYNRFCVRIQECCYPSASRATPSCSKNKIIPTKRSSSTPKRQSFHHGVPRGRCAFLLGAHRATGS